MSAYVDGGESVGETLASSSVRARSTVVAAPFVATLMPSTPRASSSAAGTFAAGQVYVSTLELKPRGPLKPSAGNSAVAAPAGQRPSAGTVASCAHETTPAGIGVTLPSVLTPNALTPRFSKRPGIVSPGTARTTSTPWTPGTALSWAASGAAGAAGPGVAVPDRTPGALPPATAFDADICAVSTRDSAMLPNLVGSLASWGVIAIVATVVISSASTRPLTERNAARGSSPMRRAAI